MKLACLGSVALLVVACDGVSRPTVPAVSPAAPDAPLVSVSASARPAPIATPAEVDAGANVPSTPPPPAVPVTKHGQACMSAKDCGPNDACGKTHYVAPWDRLCRLRCDAKTTCPNAGGGASGICQDGLCMVSGPGN